MTHVCLKKRGKILVAFVAVQLTGFQSFLLRRMEFKQSIRGGNRRYIKEIDGDDENRRRELVDKYPFALMYYKYPPTDCVSLQEFEDLAVSRLKVLRIIERTKLKHIKNTNTYRSTVWGDVKKEGLFGFIKKTPEDEDGTKLADYEDRRKDHISHFILRLVYCKTEELRRWFIRQEVDLFMIRFFAESRQTIKNWLEYNQLKFEPIPEEEKTRLFYKLRFHSNSFLSDNTDFFKIPFTDALELVSKRKVYIERGYAYVKIKDLSFIIVTQFRMNLSQALALTARSMPKIDEDARLVPLLNNLPVSYFGQDYSSSLNGYEKQITRQMLDGLAEKSFPLCMRQLHVALRQNHHLKHYGRLQYVLFLKGIGMSLEEVLQFWREEFTRIVDADKFDRQYGYSVRHSFGKEGKRANYTPYSCVKILMSNNPSVGDHHGCPFRHTDKTLLKQKLYSYKVPSSAVNEIMDLVSQGHYQVACSRYYEATHGNALKQPIAHPNQYFEESRGTAPDAMEPNKQNSILKQSDGPTTLVYASQMSSNGSNSQHLESASMTGDGEHHSEFADEMDSIMAGIE